MLELISDHLFISIVLGLAVIGSVYGVVKALAADKVSDVQE